MPISPISHQVNVKSKNNLHNNSNSVKPSIKGQARHPHHVVEVVQNKLRNDCKNILFLRGIYDVWYTLNEG